MIFDLTPNEPLLTLPAVARRLSIGRSTAYDLVNRGLLPSIRIGRSVRIIPAILDAWLLNQSEKSANGEVHDA